MSPRRRPVADIPIPAGQAQAAVLLAFARVTAALLELQEVASTVARQLDATAKKGRRS